MWEEGDSHETSKARQLFPASHWPELEVIVLVVSSAEKDIGSTEGMQRSSELFEQRYRELPDRIARIQNALENKSFDELGK